MNYIFPVALLANTFAMTGLMIVLGLSGRPELAADFGIVHAATAALLHAFSGNARSIILNPAPAIPIATIITIRIGLVIPLGLLSWLLSSQIAAVEGWLALALVLRRCAEWIAEPRLSALERDGKHQPALRYVALESLTLLLCAAALLSEFPLPELMLGAWAISPLVFSFNFTAKLVDRSALKLQLLAQQLPHLGSTAVIGISVYVFRLLLLLLVGKVVAGDLFTAFAIGGLFGSVFASALGPTLALRESRGGMQPVWLDLAIAIPALLGMMLLAASLYVPELLDGTGKSISFWRAAFMSLIGGSVMIAAQRIRLRMLQHQSGSDVFGPDVLANILIVAAVPYLYYLAGSNTLGGLYLLSALLSLLFYWSADSGPGRSRLALKAKKPLAILLLFPLFLQLGGQVFRAPMHDYDAGGNLLLLPIPVSAVACYAGIVLLGGYAQARLTLAFIFATFSMMLISSALLAYSASGQEQAKLILLIQFVLPMFALVLGQLFRENIRREYLLADAFLGVLTVLVPLQLIATWLQGKLVLTTYLYLFSIHQNLQYVPNIFVAAYLFALYSLWPFAERRPMLVILGLMLAVYVAAAVSTLGMIALIAGLAGLVVFKRWRKENTVAVTALCLAAATVACTYFVLASSKTNFADKYRAAPSTVQNTVKLPQNVSDRLQYWHFYGSAILNDGRTAAIGHPAPPDRQLIRSAHNYFLDFAYNFGLIALLPLLALIAYTAVRVWSLRRSILEPPPLLGLVVAVGYLVLIDNMLKVGMRQPYPGIITFFLWGLLLSHLQKASSGMPLKAGA